MAAKNIHKALELFNAWMTRSPDNVTTAVSTPGVCYILDLPTEILQCITEHLRIRDLLSLSRTCQAFHALINDDNFWIHQIRCQFSPPVAQLYTSGLFQEPEYVESTDEPRLSDFEHVRTESEFDTCAKNSATHYNDEAVERRHAKMYASKEDFAKNVQYFQFNKPKNGLKVPLMKLVYFYLIDRKRQAAVDMSVIHRNNHYLVEQTNPDSLKGRVISLRSVCWLEITGRFEQVFMPGKYEVIWRMKCQPNDVSMWGNTEFTVVPSHGKLLVHRVSENDFRAHALAHGNQWFLVSMGHIIVYEPSTIRTGVRNWNNGNWKSGVSWDCIELKIAL